MEEISDSNVSTPIPLYILRIIIITASFSSPPSHPLPSSSPLPGSHPLSHTPSIKHSPCASCRASGAAFHHRPLLLPYFTPIAPSPSYANSAAPRLRDPGGVAEPPTIGAPGGGVFAVFAEDSKMLRDGSGWSAWGCEVLACIDVLMGSF